MKKNIVILILTCSSLVGQYHSSTLCNSDILSDTYAYTQLNSRDEIMQRLLKHRAYTGLGSKAERWQLVEQVRSFYKYLLKPTFYAQDIPFADPAENCWGILFPWDYKNAYLRKITQSAFNQHSKQDGQALAKNYLVTFLNNKDRLREWYIQYLDELAQARDDGADINDLQHSLKMACDQDLSPGQQIMYLSATLNTKKSNNESNKKIEIIELYHSD